MKKLLTTLSGVAAKLPAAIPDALIVSGVGAIAYGAGLVHPAAGFITGGVLMLCLGLFSAIKGK
jgi:hypothetical protein